MVARSEEQVQRRASVVRLQIEDDVYRPHILDADAAVETSDAVDAHVVRRANA